MAILILEHNMSENLHLPETQHVSLPTSSLLRRAEIRKNQEDADESDQLEPTHEEVVEALKDLMPRINYQALLTGLHQSFSHSEATKYDFFDAESKLARFFDALIGVRKYQVMLASNPNGRLEAHEYVYFDERIDRLRRVCLKLGVLEEGPSEANLPDYKFVPGREKEDAKLLTELKQILEWMDTFSQFSRYYRSEPDFHFLNEWLHRLGSYLEQAKLDSVTNARVFVEPRLVDVLQEHLNRSVEPYQQLGFFPKTFRQTLNEITDRDNRSLANHFEHIKFNGFEAPEGQKLVLQPQEILEIISEAIPPNAVQGLLEISKSELHPEERAKLLSEGIEEVCARIFFDRNRKNPNQMITRIELYEGVYIDDQASLNTTSLMVGELLTTIFHEIGHSLHTNLDYFEYQQWQEAQNTDKVAVTTYVRIKENEAALFGHREDFAESFRLFLTDSFILQLLSPARYDFFTQYFRKHLHRDQRPAFEARIKQNEEYYQRRLAREKCTPEELKQILLEQI